MKSKQIKKDDGTIIYESNMYTVDEFVNKYSQALKSYLLTRQLGDKSKKSHIVDLAVENASFAESLYISVDSFK
jgi:hypothetical protein